MDHPDRVLSGDKNIVVATLDLSIPTVFFVAALMGARGAEQISKWEKNN